MISDAAVVIPAYNENENIAEVTTEINELKVLIYSLKKKTLEFLTP